MSHRGAIRGAIKKTNCFFILDWARPPPLLAKNSEKFSVFSDKILLDWVRPPPFGQNIQKITVFSAKTHFFLLNPFWIGSDPPPLLEKKTKTISVFSVKVILDSARPPPPPFGKTSLTASPNRPLCSLRLSQKFTLLGMIFVFLHHSFQKIRTVVSFSCLFNINSPFDSLDEAPWC